MSKVLYIPPAQPLSVAVRLVLDGAGFRAVVARSGMEGLAWLARDAHDVVVLARQPRGGPDGLEMLAAIRTRTPAVRVLMVSDDDSVADRVLCLEGGADDYLAAPFEPAELTARLHALMRRGSDGEAWHPHVADLELDLAGRGVARGRREIQLTPREFELLACLVRHHGRTVTRDTLAREVWHEVRRVTSLDNAIDVHIAHLRHKLDAGEPVKLIRTVRGVGFMLRSEVGR